jgi:hypothetical protein
MADHLAASPSLGGLASGGLVPDATNFGLWYQKRATLGFGTSSHQTLVGVGMALD